MLTRTRTTLITLIAAAGFATATIAPAVSEAKPVKQSDVCKILQEWHTGAHRGQEVATSLGQKELAAEYAAEARLTQEEAQEAGCKWAGGVRLEVNSPKLSKLAKEITVEAEAPKTVGAGVISKGIAVERTIG